MMDSFMPKQIYNSKRKYIQLKTPYEASLKEELDLRGSRIRHKAFTFLCDLMKQLQNDEDLWKENMVKSPVYGNRIRLHIFSNILKGIVLIHKHRLLKLLNDVTNPRMMTFSYNRRYVKVKIVEPLSKNKQIRLVSQISKLPSQQQIQNMSPVVDETSTVVDVHPVPSHTVTEIPPKMIQTIAEVHSVPQHIAEEMRQEVISVERKNELPVEIYQAPEHLATPLVASGLSVLAKSTVEQLQLHESVETTELQESVITELAPSKQQQPQSEVAREFEVIIPANWSTVSDRRNMYMLSSIAAETDQLTTARSAISFNDIDLIETETEYLARIQKAGKVSVVPQRNGRRSAFTDHIERPVLHELVIEAEVHEIPTNHKDVEKLHECMDKTVADRRELLIEQPFNASIEFQSSIVHLIQEHLEDIQEIPEREKDKILMEGDQEQVNITTIEPVTIERTGVIEQSEQEAVPVEEPLPLLRDVVDTASHEEHSMENSRVFEGKKSIHFTKRIMKNRLNRKGIQKSYISPVEIIDFYQEQQYHLLDPCRIIFDDDVLDINDVATYIDPDYLNIFIDEIDYHKIPLDEFHSDCWSIQFSDHHRTSEIFLDKDTRREIENDRQLLDVLRKSTGGQVASPRFSFPFQGLTSAREKAKKSSIFNILLLDHEQSDIVQLITSIGSLNKSFDVEAPRITDVPRIVEQLEETVERPFQIGLTSTQERIVSILTFSDIITESSRPELLEKIVTTDQTQTKAYITDAETRIGPVSFIAEPQAESTKKKIEDVTVRTMEKNLNVMSRLEEMERTFREPVAEEIVPAQATELQHDKARDAECPDIPWLRKSTVTGVPIFEEQENLIETQIVRRRIYITKADVFRKISDLIESAEIAPIRFSDVCPVETTSRLIAAATFSRLLGLHADKQIILHQDLGRMSSESILIYPI